MCRPLDSENLSVTCYSGQMTQFSAIIELLCGLALLAAAYAWWSVARTGGDKLGDRLSPRRIRAAALLTVIALGILGLGMLTAAADRLS